MLLILTSAGDATADYLASRLEGKSIRYVRIDTDTLLSDVTIAYSVAKPKLFFRGMELLPGDISNIWYRRPETLRDDRYSEPGEEKFALSEWGAAIDGFFAHVPLDLWMNHPASNYKASNKLEQLTSANAVGLQVPDTLVTQDPQALRDFFESHHGRVITKPLYQGYVEYADKNDALIYTNQVSWSDLTKLDDLAQCPTFFQQCIAKQADYRITFVDGEFHTSELLALDDGGVQRCDIRRNNMDDVSARAINLPQQIEEKLRLMMKQYGLRFGAIDMALSTEGEWIFFEVNPNGQWAWQDIAWNFDIASSFIRSFGSY